LKIPYKYRPGWGFLVLGLSVVLTVVFLTFGIQRAPLDACWLLQERMKAGVPAITQQDAQRAVACLETTKGLGEALLAEAGTGLYSGLIDGLRPGFDALTVKPLAKTLTLECRDPVGASLQVFLGEQPAELLPGQPLALPSGKGKEGLALVIQFTGAEALGCQAVAK
jgi:hypothetical protein